MLYAKEISMVAASMLHIMDDRMRQITGRNTEWSTDRSGTPWCGPRRRWTRPRSAGTAQQHAAWLQDAASMARWIVNTR